MCRRCSILGACLIALGGGILLGRLFHGAFLACIISMGLVCVGLCVLRDT